MKKIFVSILCCLFFIVPFHANAAGMPLSSYYPNVSEKVCIQNDWEWYIRPEDKKTYCIVPVSVQEAIELAIKDADEDYLENILSRGLPVDFGLHMFYGAPLLSAAFHFNQCGVAEMLLKHGASRSTLQWLLEHRSSPPCSHLKIYLE